MRVDLLAGTVYRRAIMLARVPTILVFDSGLGGLTVYSEIARARPDARFIYAADDAGFPYGRLIEPVLVARVVELMERLIAVHEPDIVVIACNTASTLVLPHLRAQFRVPFVGTVPAIKPAAAVSSTKHISVLATPGTVARDYTHDLIARYASDCAVTLVGSARLAGLAEAAMTGSEVSDAEIAREIEPCFVEVDGRRTDTVVLACTHYPLILDRLSALAPWPVTFIDPAPAIARRVVELIGEPLIGVGAADLATAVFTGGAGLAAPVERALARRGLSAIAVDPLPLVVA